MSQLEDAQRLLPEGLVLTQKMDIPVPQGRAFQAEDHRYKVSPPVLRLVRLIEVSEHDDWHGRWLKQLGDLSRRAIDGVSRPLEMGLAGPNHVYLIFDRFPATLADLIPATGLPDRRAAWSVLNQLVVALAELHGAHGDLRADHIMVDTEHLTHESRVWLGGVELGPLAHWSFLPDQSCFKP